MGLCYFTKWVKSLRTTCVFLRLFQTDERHPVFFATMILYLLPLMVLGVPSIAFGFEAKDHIFMTKDDNSVCKISLFSSAECEEVVGKLPQFFNEITSMTRSDLNSELYFVANHKYQDSSTVFASHKNKHWCLYHGRGLKKVAYDWSTDNLFIAADGLGIGVCTSKAVLNKKCSHVIAAHKHQLSQGYGSLLVYPRRGVIYWVDYNSDYPNGVVMKAGMNGKSITSLTNKSGRKVMAIALDDLNDNLYIAYADGLVKMRLSDFSVSIINVDLSLLSSSMVSVNGSVYSMSKESKTLMKLTGVGKNINMPEVGGKCVFLAYSTGFQDARYSEMVDPCLSANCSHNCVLKEVYSIDSKALSTCIPRDDDLIRDAIKPGKESLKIIWIQIGCLLPTIIIVCIVCFLLVYEIVWSHLSYLQNVD